MLIFVAVCVTALTEVAVLVTLNPDGLLKRQNYKTLATKNIIVGC